MTSESHFKTKEVSGRGKIGVTAFKQYKEIYYGDVSLGRAMLTEVIFALFGTMPGCAGLWLRSKVYPWVLGSTGAKVMFGKNITFRHPHKVRIGAHTIIDDNCVVDAKGQDNEGITIGAGVYIGRNTIIYCKNGNIRIGDNVNISSNCQFVSSNDMTIGGDTVIGAYSYLLSGGGYTYGEGARRFAEQDGFLTKGKLVIGDNCWLGARVTVLDAAGVGENSVLAAGAVVTKPVSPGSVAVGVPAHVVKTV